MDSDSSLPLVAVGAQFSRKDRRISNTAKSFTFIVLILTASAAISTYTSFDFLPFPTSKSSKPAVESARRLNKLKRPVVVMISSDGFRFGYQFKTHTPNIGRLIQRGTEAKMGLIPVFPTQTYPNHNAIATGLYPVHHGIVSNGFPAPDYNFGGFDEDNVDPKWWVGEPIWETLANQGLKASTYFWPGSVVKKGKWTCPNGYCMKYNQSVPFEERVDTVLGYFDSCFTRCSMDIPAYMNLYFHEPDLQGHRFGPDSPQVTDAVSTIDEMIGRLIKGLEQRGIFEDVHIILLGDHGMVATCDSERSIFLDEIAELVPELKKWDAIEPFKPILAIRPPKGTSTDTVASVVKEMNAVLSSNKVKNGDKLKVYRKEDLPSRVHYKDSDRIPAVIGLVSEGYSAKVDRKKIRCGGIHGYDNDLFSMRSIFIGHGPRFRRNHKVASFLNVEIYNMVADILQIKGTENDGNSSFAAEVLLHLH